MDHQAEPVEVGIGVDQHPLDGLAFGERLAEGHPFLRIAGAQLQAALHHADAARAVPDAPGADPVLGEPEPFALLADAVLHRDPHVLEGDLPGPVVHHRFLRSEQRHAGRIHLHQEPGNAAARAFLPIRRGEDLREIRFVGAGDESFGAVDHIVIAVADRGGPHRAGIAARVGLGLGEARLLLARDDRQQIALLLVPR